MKKLERLEAKIDELEELLDKAKEEKEDYLRKTVCDKEGHDNRNIFTGCWECKFCGHRHWTI